MSKYGDRRVGLGNDLGATRAVIRLADRPRSPGLVEFYEFLTNRAVTVYMHDTALCSENGSDKQDVPHGSGLDRLGLALGATTCSIGHHP